MKKYADVDAYLGDSRRWTGEIIAVREILLAAGLTEEVKWGKPCYRHDGANVVILQEMKDFLALMFFKGALLADPAGILEDQGPNSRSARRLCITSPAQVSRHAATIAAYVDEAIEVERSGLEVDSPPTMVPVPELQQRLDGDARLREAFTSLTPGRQREYNIYFSGAKQSATREARVERCAERILDGRGLRDR